MKIKKEYIKYIKKILKVLLKYKLNLKLKKYKFYIRKTKFLEYIIILEKIKIDLAKVNFIFI